EGEGHGIGGKARLAELAHDQARIALAGEGAEVDRVVAAGRGGRQAHVRGWRALLRRGRWSGGGPGHGRRGRVAGGRRGQVGGILVRVLRRHVALGRGGRGIDQRQPVAV